MNPKSKKTLEKYLVNHILGFMIIYIVKDSPFMNMVSRYLHVMSLG